MTGARDLLDNTGGHFGHLSAHLCCVLERHSKPDVQSPRTHTDTTAALARFSSAERGGSPTSAGGEEFEEDDQNGHNAEVWLVDY